MARTIEQLISRVSSLVTFPSIGVRVNEMVNDPSCSVVDLGKVIGQDPGLTARLLRVANSPAYGLSRQVDTITRAIAVLGQRQIRDLVLATTTASTFKGIPNDLVTMENFWRHSIYCGLAARALGERRGTQGAESLFIAGLLHDIGQLVLFHEMPDEARQAILLSLEGPEEFAQHSAEQKIIGFDHSALGAALLRHWHFPELLIECVEHHHSPAAARKYPIEVALVHIANSLAGLAEINSLSEDDALQTDPVAWKSTGLDKGVIEPVVRTIQESFVETQGLFV